MTAFNILYQDQGVLIAQTYAEDSTPFSDNVGLHVGDDAKTVLGRRAKLLASLMPYGVKAITWLNQVHGDGIVKPTPMSLTPANADAQFSQASHHALAIMTADCVPVAVFDKTSVACIHAGWQGLVAGIIPKTLANFSKQPHAYIGACIGGASYELPMAMAIQILTQCVTNGLVNLSYDALFAEVIAKTNNDKAYLDVGKLARCQLVACGAVVLNDDIVCTYTGNFHSHRRATHQGVQAGRMAMVIAKL